MQSLMRKAKVGPGNKLTPRGEYAQAPSSNLEKMDGVEEA